MRRRNFSTSGEKPKSSKLRSYLTAIKGLIKLKHNPMARAFFNFMLRLYPPIPWLAYPYRFSENIESFVMLVLKVQHFMRVVCLFLSENDDQGKTDLEELIRYKPSDTEKAIKRSFLRPLSISLYSGPSH